MGEITETITFTFENAQQQRRFHEVLKEGWSAVPAPSDAKLREALRSAQIGFECVMEAAEHEGVDECREIARRAVADVRAALTTDGGDK